MSSEDSRTTTVSSRLSQFGIYKSIDARTEEFLRLSRKRQLRQGCACAAVSTAITVTVVVVILLIYEYAIVVESSLVQKLRYNITNGPEDIPVADKLGRSFLGFDQDYYERMPLLVNAMQENNYVDPAVLDTSSVKPKVKNILDDISKPTSNTFNYKTNSIRRTSPRPFYFEYKSPTPTPFTKTYGSRNWIDNYRNAHRLKNLQQVIKYLEKTINAKFGDLYALPTSTIAFSGLYVEPTISQAKNTSPTSTVELLSQGSNIIEKYKSNHRQDPLYSFKPDSPGDVNLLADGFFRFSPVPTPSLLKETLLTTIPMFRPITPRTKKCVGLKCIIAESKAINSEEVNDYKGVISHSHDKPNTFSVLLNLFPIKPVNFDNRKSYESPEGTQMPINKIYITTSRPVVQFKRKSTTPLRRTTTRIITRPRMLPKRKLYKTAELNFNKNQKPAVEESKMIVHVNVYPPTEVKDQATTQSNIDTTITTPRYSTPIPMLTSTQVEDYHVGSSGIIPPEARLTPAPPPPLPKNIPTLPTTTTMIPFFDKISTSTEPNFGNNNPPEILKFGHEDAKIPEHYKDMFQPLEKHNNSPGANRRNSNESVEIDEDYETEPSTLIAKLKNDGDEKISGGLTTEKTPDEKDSHKTYVPLINGHYRSLNQNSKNINTWINDNTQVNRKRRLDMAVTGFRKTTYVPQYVEIKRNNTRNPSDDAEYL